MVRSFMVITKWQSRYTPLYNFWTHYTQIMAVAVGVLFCYWLLDKFLYTLYCEYNIILKAPFKIFANISMHHHSPHDPVGTLYRENWVPLNCITFGHNGHGWSQISQLQYTMYGLPKIKDWYKKVNMLSDCRHLTPFWCWNWKIPDKK